MDDVVTVWNQHHIRLSSNGSVPHGQPNYMFLFPELWGSVDYLCHVDQYELNVCIGDVTFRGYFSCDKDVFQLCCIIMHEQHLTIPNEQWKLTSLYLTLRNEIRNML